MPILNDQYGNGLVFSTIGNGKFQSVNRTSNVKFVSDQECLMSSKSSNKDIEIIWNFGSFVIFPYSYIVETCYDRRYFTEWQIFGRYNENDQWIEIDYRLNFDIGTGKNPKEVEIQFQRKKGPFRFILLKILDDQSHNSNDLLFRLNKFEIRELKLGPICTFCKIKPNLNYLFVYIFLSK